MLNKIHQILKDPECKSNIQCLVWSCVTMFIMFGGFIALMIFLNHTTYNSNINWAVEQHEKRISELEKLEGKIMPSAFKGNKNGRKR